MKETILENVPDVLEDLAKRRGIHLLDASTPVPDLRVNIYFVERPVPTLIDAPMKSPSTADELDAQLRPLGYSLDDIEVIIITHPHIDHFGFASDLGARSGAKVWATEDTALWIGDFEGECLEEERFQMAFLERAGVPRDLIDHVGRYFQFLKGFGSSVTPSRLLELGESIELASGSFSVEHVPGHTPWCSMLVDTAGKIAFTGDFLLKDISSNPLVQRPSKVPDGYGSLKAYRSSLERVAGMGLRLALPGHGEVMTDPRGRITALLGFMSARTRQVAEVLGKEPPLTMYGIVRKIFPDLPRNEVFLAVSEVFAHLDLLEEKGVVLRDEAVFPPRFSLHR